MTILEMLKQDNVKDRVYDALNKAKEVQKDINAVVTFVDPQHQLNELGEKNNQKMYGVPIVLKDNVNTKGIRTTASCALLDNYIPIYDATIVKKLKDAGAIVIAKSSMDELAMGGTNLTSHTGPVKNPYDLNRIAGGSSGGSAALVASGVVPFAIGSDTGDSVRKPASYCNVVGLKPTYGRISRFGIIPYASSLDHVGLFTRSVKDAAIGLEVLSGRDDRDMTSSYRPVEDYLSNISGDVKGKRIGIIKNVIDNINNKEIVTLFNDLIDKLKTKGAIISYVDLDDQLLKAVLPTYYIIANCEATANHANLTGLNFGVRKAGDSALDIMNNTRTQGFGEVVKKRFVIGSYGLFVENQDKLFRKAQKVRRLIVEKTKEQLADIDVIVAPAAPSVAPKINEISKECLSNEYLISDNYMVVGNFTGYPSITIPMGFVDNMPVGINLTAKAFDESNLLNIAYAFEQASGLENSKVGK